MKINKLLIVLISIVFIMISCKEDACTDTEAINYNSSNKVKTSNELCEYEGNIAFYIKPEDYQKLFDDETDSLKFYVAGNYLGALAISDTLNANLESSLCGLKKYPQKKFNLTNSVAQEYSYKIIGKNNNKIYADGELTVSANKCTSNSKLNFDIN